jgi:succinate dehydrogenase/fumarate reductase flavoprotein subunit
MRKKMLLCLLAGGLCIGFFTCTSTSVGSGSTAAAYVNAVAWDAEYDVVVVGFGGAGAAAAVSAADAGARVLLLEKAPEGEEGGNTRYAMQAVLLPSQRDAAIRYFKNLRGVYDNQGDDVIEFIVDGSIENPDWLKKVGLSPDRIKIFPTAEYPELGGKEGIGAFFIDGLRFQSTLWQFLRSLVYERTDAIDIWYDSPGTRLIQDPDTKIIHGVVVSHGGKSYRVRAKNGVVLATGGFENNDEMLENYAQLGDAYGMGARFNTGDGIKMAMDVGADLWHMSTLSGPYLNFVNPDTNNAMFVLFNSPEASAFATGFGALNMIIVGGNGRRFTNEIDTSRHGHVNVGGTWFSRLIPQNAWCVFDESARKTAPAYKQWSPGMEDEINKGWIVQANSIRELAAKINIDPTVLEAEVNKYNGYCKNGLDPEFNVNPHALKPLETGPYYAFPLKATLINTQGGPKRNVNCEVLDVWGNPIPHLYSAGELGSFYPDIYQGAGNLSECLFTGRRAGINAAAPKRDGSTASVMGNKTPVDFRSGAGAVIATGAGEYLGTGSGIGGELIVKIKLDGQRILSVEVVKHNETPGISDKALETIPRLIVENQSPQVDTVSGATVTSRAIMAAAEDALSKAR